MKIFPLCLRFVLMGIMTLMLGATLLSMGPAAAQEKGTPTPLPLQTLAILPSMTAAASSTPAPQPLEQQTLDAIVADLIAQTQQAAPHIQSTQTVQAALDHVLNLTAAAQMQSAATNQSVMNDLGTATQAAMPTPILYPAAQLEVINVVDTELMAGPAQTNAYLAPDGQHFAYLQGAEFCIYTIEGEQERCLTLPDGIDWGSPRWSPDSRYVVFHEDFYRYFRDADIWLIDTADDSLTNLTDDQTDEVSILEDSWSNVDVAPRWLPDGRIAFLRYSRENGNHLPPDIYAATVDGGAPELLGTIRTNSTIPITMIDVSNDGSLLAYNHISPEDTPTNGAWVSAIDGSAAEQVLATERIYAPTSVEISADGRYLLSISGGAFGQFGVTEPVQAVRVVDLETGEITILDEDIFIRTAGWSPSGSALAYLVNDSSAQQNSGLYITDTPGQPGRLVLQGEFIAPTNREQQGLIWAANNTILLSNTVDYLLQVVQLG